MPVNSFSPKKLKVVRDQMVRSGKLCRKQINAHTTKIIRIFSWGVEEELVNPNVVLALREVKHLPPGEFGTFDHPERKYVDDDVVRRTLPYMSRTVATMVQIQRLTGMRPSELCEMTVGDIDRTRGTGLWYYVLPEHKTAADIGEKQIPLNGSAQKLLEPFLTGKKSDEAVFSHRVSAEEVKEILRAERQSTNPRLQKEQDKQRTENPRTKAKEFFDRNTYRKAIVAAIKRANKKLPPDQQIPHWFPYQIRHSTSTAIEIAEGLDKSQAVLGHKTPNTTRIYSKGQLAIAENVVRKLENPFESDGDETL